MNIIEIVGVAFGLISVYLTVKQSILSWPTGIISVIAFGLLFFDIKLYADMTLQGFYIITGFIGWYMWKFGGEKKTELKVSTLTNTQRFAVAFVLTPLVFVIGWVLRAYTDAALPFIDSFAAALSIVAQLLLMKKYLENWMLWITVDVISIGMYIFKGVYLTAGLYVIYLILATLGLIEWYASRKTYEKETNKRIGFGEVCPIA
jgi:nicotinamide mononucleotide transporter